MRRWVLSSIYPVDLETAQESFIVEVVDVILFERPFPDLFTQFLLTKSKAIDNYDIVVVA